EHTIEVREHGTHRPLHNGRFRTRLITEDHFTDLLRGTLRGGAWSTFAQRDGGKVALSGWFIAPEGIGDARITANGRPIDLRITHGDSGWRTPLPPGFSARTFVASAPIDDASEEMRFSFGSDRPFRPLQDLTLPLFALPVPDTEHRKRVDGHGNLGGFN